MVVLTNAMFLFGARDNRCLDVQGQRHKYGRAYVCVVRKGQVTVWVVGCGQADHRDLCGADLYQCQMTDLDKVPDA